MNDLESILEILTNYHYDSFGFPMFMLYREISGNWNCSFRNPQDFNNPDCSADTAIASCLKMIDFLAELKTKKDGQETLSQRN